MVKDFGDVEVRESNIKQFSDSLGVFAKKDFKKGDVVIQWRLKVITQEEYKRLPDEERQQFTHKRKNQIIFYPDPERHVNRYEYPNVYPDFEKEADIALRDIKKGEELSIPKDIKEDFGNE